MSRYEDLAKKAVDWSERFWIHLEACRGFAREIVGMYALYSDAPTERMEYVELNDDLRSTGRVTGSLGPLIMRTGKDGLQYFAFSLALKTDCSRYTMAERVIVGLKKDESGWTIAWNDTLYDVPFSDLNKIHVLFDAWITTSLEMYEGSVNGSRSAAMGFLPSR